MSYILDALRRAEAERERGGVPGLHAQAVGGAASAPAGRPASSGRWTVPVLVVLVAAIGLLAWRPWANDRTAPSAAPAPAPVATIAVPAVGTPVPAPVPPSTPPVAPLKTVEAPVQRTGVPPVPIAAAAKKRTVVAARNPVAEAANPAAASSPGEPKVYTIADLPQEVRSQLPPVTVGGSIYSTSPQNRFVIVNGQLFHEGDTLAPGLVLQQIRLKSAVLMFRGYRYGITL